MVLKYAVSNISAHRLATMASNASLTGSTWEGFGFGLPWGIEPTAFIEFGGVIVTKPYDDFIWDVLAETGEVEAYRIVDGSLAGPLTRGSVIEHQGG